VGFEPTDVLPENCSRHNESPQKERIELLCGQGSATRVAKVGSPEWLASWDRDKLLRYRIRDRALHWQRLYQLSKSARAPIKARIPGSHAGPSNEARADPNTAISEHSYCVIKVWLRELTVHPRFMGIGDVLRLGKDTRFTDFRDSVSKWAQALSEGAVSQERRLREDIWKANQELTRVTEYRTKAEPLLCLLVPVAVAATLGMLGDASLPGSMISNVRPLGQTVLKNFLSERKVSFRPG
jgi:hypothetical protein